MASEIFFSTNPAEWTKVEGLSIDERNPPGFIQGRDLSAVGMAGMCVRGPLTPQRIGSVTRFLEVYGGRDYVSGGTLYGEVWKALLNKRFGTVVVRRVAAAAAAAGSITLSNVTPTAIATVTASSVGAWSTAANGGPTVKVENATDADVNHWNLRVTYQGKDYLYENLNTQSGSDNLATVIGDDIANLVVVTKTASGRPLNSGPSALTGGSDGSIAATDYNAGMNDLAVTPGVAVCIIPEAPPTPATVNGNIVSLAATVSDRVFLTWSGTFGQSVSTEIAALGTQITTKSDRIVWCYNGAQTLDPVTGLKIDTAPHVWLASIMSQTDVDIHKGDHDTMQYLAGITGLRNETLSRQDLIDLRAAGISTLEKLSDGFLFRSAVVTLLTTGKTELSRRLMTDFLQLSATDRLKYHVKKKNTVERRALIRGEVNAFAEGLKEQGRIVDAYFVDSDSVNTPAQRAQGIEHLLWKVKLVNHILFFVLDTEIGATVEISQ